MKPTGLDERVVVVMRERHKGSVPLHRSRFSATPSEIRSGTRLALVSFSGRVTLNGIIAE